MSCIVCLGLHIYHYWDLQKCTHTQRLAIGAGWAKDVELDADADAGCRMQDVDATMVMVMVMVVMVWIVGWARAFGME